MCKKVQRRGKTLKKSMTSRSCVSTFRPKISLKPTVLNMNLHYGPRRPEPGVRETERRSIAMESSFGGTSVGFPAANSALRSI